MTAQIHFEQPYNNNHRVIKRMIAMCAGYDYQRDESILLLRKIAGLPSRIRPTFIKSINAVAQCLSFHVSLKIQHDHNNQKVIFAIPDHLYVADIAKQCNVSRHTVHRVLSYLTAIGDLITHTQFDKAQKKHSPTRIYLTSEFFLRLGFKLDELQGIVKTLNHDAQGNEVKKTKTRLNRHISQMSQAARTRIHTTLRKVFAETKPTSSSKPSVASHIKKFIDTNKSMVDVSPSKKKMVNIDTSDYVNEREKISNMLVNEDYKRISAELRKSGVKVSELHSKTIAAMQNSKK